MDSRPGRRDEPPALTGTIRILTLLLVISLGLHAATIWTLWQARSAAHAQAITLANEIGAAGQSVITLDVPLNQPIPVQASVPIRKTLQVPIDTTIDIDRTFDVPLRTPLGNYTIPVPFRGQIPVKLTAPVSIDETVQISTTIQLDTSLAVELPISETPLAAYLDRLRQGLIDLAAQL